jgi:multiple sugar transport system substrate-binding protein
MEDVMLIRRKLPALLSFVVTSLAMLLAEPTAAQQKTEITFARFFGACEGDYGTSQDVAHARGECGVMTTLVNLFNATNKENIVVKPQIIEWGPYYQQLNARIAASRRLPSCTPPSLAITPATLSRSMTC